MMYYNCHIHTFRDCDVPLKFLPLGLVRVLASQSGFVVISKIMNNLNPFSERDIFDRYLRFVKIGRLGSQEKIFDECRRFYPEGTKFVILPMDLAYMKAGKVSRAYVDQLKELAALAEAHPEVIPFIHIDPRRKDYMDLFKRSVEEWGFKGVKIYPSIGYFPYDERLYPVYGYCEKYSLPVLSHCSPYNPVNFRGNRNELLEMLSKSRAGTINTEKKRGELCAHFTDPQNWSFVMDDFSKLRVCLAHFGSAYYMKRFLNNPGSGENWFLSIKSMIYKYDNLYTDVSFTMNNTDYFSLLKVMLADNVLKSRILFGSDYYMVETETTERRFGIDLRAFIGEEYFDEIARINPERFLGENVSLSKTNAFLRKSPEFMQV